MTMDFREQKEILRLLQLCSPALPTGAFAYSQGLEFAVSAGWVNDKRSASDWIQGLLKNSLANLDVPVLFRLHQAWSTNDIKNIHYWNDFLYASRDSAELQAEERQLSQALARLLIDLGILEAVRWREQSKSCFLSMFALGAMHWKISVLNASLGYLWMWAENQVLAAIKLVPLGQTDGQKILSSMTEMIPNIVLQGSSMNDEDIGFSATGQSMSSALHETQYTRLFRS